MQAAAASEPSEGFRIERSIRNRDGGTGLEPDTLSASKQTHQGPAVHTFPAPDTPQIEHWITIFSSPEYRPWLSGIRERSKEFLPFIKGVVDEFQVPLEIAYLPAVESTFKVHALSSSGASGLWQFMRNSIGPWDMEIDQWRDDRRDFWKATRGAVEKLKYNYSVTGDWYLALAAYNCGLGRVQRTVESSGIHDFWELSSQGLLPRETIQYVPRFLAAAHIMSYPGRWGLPMDWNQPVHWVRIPLDQAVDLKILAERSGIPLEKLTLGNGELRFGITPPESSQYQLKVPEEYSDSIREILEQEENRLMRFYIYRITSGDTFYALAEHYGISVSMLREYNRGVSPTALRIGQQVIIPALRETPPYKPDALSISSSFTGVYTVVSGDSLWSISRNLGITPEELALNNGMDLNGILHAGKRLQVPEKEERDEQLF